MELTTEERATFNYLISIGDTKDQALATILKSRK